MNRSEKYEAITDLLRRFNPPRAYAGDYCGDFADRILAAIGEPRPEPEKASPVTA